MVKDNPCSTFMNTMPPPNLSDRFTSQLNDLQFLASIASNQSSIPTHEGTTTSSSIVPFDAGHAVTGQLSQSKPQPTPKIHGSFNQDCATSSRNFREAPVIQNLATCNHEGLVFQPQTSSIQSRPTTSSYAGYTGNFTSNSGMGIHRTRIDLGSLYRSNHRDFIIYIYVLMKVLRKKPSGSCLYQKAKHILQECLSCHKAGVAGYTPLIDVIDGRLRSVDGMAIHIRRTEGYFKRYLNKKRGSSIESVVN